jgi:uncharacterized protein (TIGR03435 family)
MERSGGHLPMPSGRLGWSGVVVAIVTAVLTIPMSARPAPVSVRMTLHKGLDERLIVSLPHVPDSSAEIVRIMPPLSRHTRTQAGPKAIALASDSVEGAPQEPLSRGVLGLAAQTAAGEAARLAIPPRPSSGVGSAFSEVSIRPHVSGPAAGYFDAISDGGRGGWLNAIGLTTADLIAWAYGTSDRESLGGPSWVHATRFDIRARIDGVVAERAWKAMMQRVLEERFGLTLRLERRERPMYSLVLADPEGPYGAYIERVDGCETGLPLRIAPPGAAVSGGCTGVRFIASVAAGHLGAPVIDRTGVSGLFRMWMYWAPESGQVTWDRLYRNVRLDQVDAPRFADALEQHLGLRLEPSYGSADVLVLVDVSAPTID